MRDSGLRAIAFAELRGGGARNNTAVNAKNAKFEACAGEMPLPQSMEQI